MLPTVDQRRECQQLDAYLNGDLADDDAKRFTVHIGTCASCRAAVEQQAWLDGLLRQSTTAEAVPAGVLVAINKGIAPTRYGRRLAGGFAAAAAILIAVFFGHDPTPQGADLPQLTTAAPPTPSTAPVATFVGTDDMIVVHHDSPYPDVTIVEVYPTITARRRWQREAAEDFVPVPLQIPGDPS